MAYYLKFDNAREQYAKLPGITYPTTGDFFIKMKVRDLSGPGGGIAYPTFPRVLIGFYDSNINLQIRTANLSVNESVAYEDFPGLQGKSDIRLFGFRMNMDSGDFFISANDGEEVYAGNMPDIAQFRGYTTPNNGTLFNSFGIRYQSGELEWLNINDEHLFKAELADGKGLSLLNQNSDRHGELVGYDNDDSQWVYYDKALASEGLRLHLPGLTAGLQLQQPIDLSAKYRIELDCTPLSGPATKLLDGPADTLNALAVNVDAAGVIENQGYYRCEINNAPTGDLSLYYGKVITLAVIRDDLVKDALSRSLSHIGISSQLTAGFNGYIYEVRVYDGDQLIHRYTPTDSKGMGYLVDKVSANHALPVGFDNFDDALLFYSNGERPAADAGPNLVFEAGSTGTLDGSNSKDDQGITQFHWQQLTGPATTIADSDKAMTTFEVPSDYSGQTMSFMLTTRDAQGNKAQSAVTHTIAAAADPYSSMNPNDGSPEIEYWPQGFGARVSLLCQLTNRDHIALTFNWAQIQGQAVTLERSDTANPYFDAPSLVAAETLVFTCTVTNAVGVSDTTTHKIIIKPNPTLLRALRLKPMEFYNESNFTSEPFLPPCASFDLSAYGDFGSGEARIEAGMPSNGETVWVRVSELVWSETRQEKLQLHMGTRYRVVIENCNDVSVELKRGL